LYIIAPSSSLNTTTFCLFTVLVLVQPHPTNLLLRFSLEIA
jgi:hypothetical protein